MLLDPCFDWIFLGEELGAFPKMKLQSLSAQGDESIINPSFHVTVRGFAR